MKHDPNIPSPTALKQQGIIERKAAKYEKDAAERRERQAYAAQIDADVAAGILPVGTLRCRPSDKLGMRLEAHRRQEAKREQQQREREQVKPNKPKKPTAASVRADARAAERLRWREYERQVRELTEQLPLHLVPGIGLRGQDYHLDHKHSVRAAYKVGLPAEECADIGNLQVLTRWENFRKGTACYSSLDARQLPMAA